MAGTYDEDNARYHRCHISAVVYMNGSSDYVELFFFGDVSSGTATIHGDSGDGAFMDGCLISRTA